MNESAKKVGTLFLVPTPLDFGCEVPGDIEQVLPDGTLQVAARLTHWICENAKSSRAFLKRVASRYPLAASLQEQIITELPRSVHKKGDHAPSDLGSFDPRKLLGQALAGHDIGLISEAGMPAIADPGSSVVRAAHDMGIPVQPLVGPVSILLAMAASGLNGQNFAFVGYLPQGPAERLQRIGELETAALRTGQSQLFIETPYRNTALLQALLNGLQHHTRLSVSTGLTLDQGKTQSQLVKVWRQTGISIDARLPAVFAIGR